MASLKRNIVLNLDGGVRVHIKAGTEVPAEYINHPYVQKVLGSRSTAGLKPGPTLEAFVKAGYPAASYPMPGFAEVQSPMLKRYRATGSIELGPEKNGVIIEQNSTIKPPEGAKIPPQGAPAGTSGAHGTGGTGENTLTGGDEPAPAPKESAPPLVEKPAGKGNKNKGNKNK